MRQNKWLGRVLVVLLLSGLLSMTVTVASGVGTDNDPLVTLSYLKETFMNDIMKKVDEKIADRNKQSGSSWAVRSAAERMFLTLSQL